MHQKRSVKRHPVVQPLDKSIRLIPLTQGQNAIVDASDYDWLSQWNWVAHWCPHTQSFYARRNESVDGRRRTLRMHVFILGCKSGECGDHRNHDTLDNRRVNLRKCTNAQNAMNRRMPKTNSTGFKGVSWHKRTRKWRARIGQTELGLFATKEQAAIVYNQAAIVKFGE